MRSCRVLYVSTLFNCPNGCMDPETLLFLQKGWSIFRSPQFQEMGAMYLGVDISWSLSDKLVNNDWVIMIVHGPCLRVDVFKSSWWEANDRSIAFRNYYCQKHITGGLHQEVYFPMSLWYELCICDQRHLHYYSVIIIITFFL